eukprot:5388701-Prymnesium_polylepis.1
MLHRPAHAGCSEICGNRWSAEQSKCVKEAAAEPYCEHVARERHGCDQSCGFEFDLIDSGYYVDSVAEDGNTKRERIDHEDVKRRVQGEAIVHHTKGACALNRKQEQPGLPYCNIVQSKVGGCSLACGLHWSEAEEKCVETELKDEL